MSQGSTNSSVSSPGKQTGSRTQRQTEACRTLNVYFTFIVLLLIWTSSALAQSSTESERARKIALEMLHGREIPESTLPCTPEEAKWWQDLRAAAKAVKETRGSKKEKQKFLDLLQLGQEKSYQPPIPNSGPFILSRAEPMYSPEARRKQITGSIALVAELRADGFVGEVEIVQGLGHGLDDNAKEAARRTLFLPPVKNRKFVPLHLPMTMSFNIW